MNVTTVKKEQLSLTDFVKMRSLVTKECSDSGFTRAEVPIEFMNWRVPYDAYNPLDYTDRKITEIYHCKDPKMVIWADPDSIHDKVSTGRTVKEEFDLCELRVKLHGVDATKKLSTQGNSNIRFSYLGST